MEKNIKKIKKFLPKPCFVERIKRNIFKINFIGGLKFLIKIFKNKKCRLVILSITSFVLLLIIICLSIYGPWWKIWPKDFRFTIALNRLAISVYEEPYCRPDCQIYRESYRQEILKNIEKDKHQEKISQIIFNEEENINWRLELLKIVFKHEKLSYFNFFPDLQNYLNKNPANLELQNLIAYYLSLNDFKNNDYVDNIKDVLADDSISIENRLKALKNLKSIDNYQADFYLALLSLEENQEIITEILRSMSSDFARFDVDRNLLLNRLEKIIRSDNSSYSSKRLGIFLLADFWDIEDGGEGEGEEENEALKLSQKLLASGEIDDFSLYFLLESLKSEFPDYFSEEKLALDYYDQVYRLSELKSEDWQWYYQQN